MKKFKVTLVSLVALITLPSYAEDSTNKRITDQAIHQFFEDKERGWFWYEQLPEEDQEKVREIIKKNHPTVIPPDTKPKQEQTTKKEDEPLSTAWFKKNFDRYKNAAIDNPYDQDAMRTYLFLEKFMNDRAKVFAYQRQAAMLAEPFLDASSSRPIANFGMKSMNQMANENKGLILTELAKHVGIYYFYRSDTVFSLQQAPLVNALAKEFNFEIKAVSMDGKPLPNNLFPQYLTDNGQAKSLGIKQVPATYLFNPQNNSVELISQGLQSLPELQKRILHASVRFGLITEEQLNLTRPSGLFVTPTGEITGGYPLPENAPQQFLDLYNHSRKLQGQ